MSNYKKVIISLFLLLGIVFTMVPVAQVSAMPYSTPWGRFYRTPEKQNKFGRCWYGMGNNYTYYSIYLESYYTYGSTVSITYYYRPSKSKKDSKKVASNYSMHGSSSTSYLRNVKGDFRKAVLFGSAYGITVNKTYTKR